jgi:WD40 repeat protein
VTELLEAKVQLWRTTDGQPQQVVLSGNTKFDADLAFSPDGEVLAMVPWREGIQLWAVKTARIVRTFPDTTGTVDRIIFDPGGALLATASTEGDLRLWHVR